MIRILNPVALSRADRERRLPLAPSLNGLKVGILTNHWKSMDRMASRMSARARQMYSASAVEPYDIPINGPMADAVEQRVMSECDVAIVGLAN